MVWKKSSQGVCTPLLFFCTPTPPLLTSVPLPPRPHTHRVMAEVMLDEIGRRPGTGGGPKEEDQQQDNPGSGGSGLGRVSACKLCRLRHSSDRLPAATSISCAPDAVVPTLSSVLLLTALNLQPVLFRCRRRRCCRRRA